MLLNFVSINLSLILSCLNLLYAKLVLVLILISLQLAYLVGRSICEYTPACKIKIFAVLVELVQFSNADMLSI